MSESVNQPFLSGICVTFGRVAWLQEAIQHFRNQDYVGPRELVVLNTCPLQRLSCDAEGVRVINCDVRPASLGEARNMAIEKAQGTHIITCDDDDVILPHHFRTYAVEFKEHDWLWLDKEFYAHGEEIKGIVQGSCPLFAFTKKAWSAVGGYASMGVGEDRNFISRVTALCMGAKVEIREFPTFIYRWGQGTFHFSGKGEVASAHTDIEEDLALRIQRGHEPTGDITLKPGVALDWHAKAVGFLHEQVKRSKKKPGGDVAIVLLGRFGDIINALPIARHIAENYCTPHWVVSKEFASIFEGVSYVIPDVVGFKNPQIREGYAWAQKKYPRVILAQIWGHGWEQIKECKSYNRESWRMCGFLHKFDDRSWRPAFDRRDYAREGAFYRKTNPERRPMLIVNVRRSVSSPFNRGEELEQIIHGAYPDLQLVDVSDWDLPYIFDLLGLMERAIAVVSIDTALLHLAAACNVPTIAIVNPTQWQGSEIRGNEFLRLNYSDAVTDVGAEAILTAIKDATPPLYYHERILDLGVKPAPDRQIFHVVERHEESNPAEKRRKALAWRSWDDLYASGQLIPAHLWDYPRNALSIGENRPLPFVKDVIKVGLDQAAADDIVMFTNDDNLLHPELPAQVRYWVSLYECCCSSRCEFMDSEIPPISNPPEVFARMGRQHMGRDLFAATKRWWLQHWEEIPDWLIGASDWDLNLCAIVRLHFGIKTTRANLEFNMHPAEMPRGYVMHRFHVPRWSDPATVDKQVGNQHNRKLFQAWASTHLPELRFYPNGTI